MIDSCTVISFPRSGRTWLRMMLGKIFVLHFGLNDKLPVNSMWKLDELSKIVPKLPSIKFSHFNDPHKITIKDFNCSLSSLESENIIFLSRDPRDILVSSYFKHKLILGIDNLKDFIYQEVGSIDVIIKYYNFFSELLEKSKKILLIKYEDIHSDAFRELKRILFFLNITIKKDEIIREAIEFAKFKNMAHLERIGQLKLIRSKDPREFPFMRKGKVGNFVNYLDKSDIDFLNKKLLSLSSIYGYKND